MKKQAKESTYLYPSHYGSHKVMVTKGPDTDGFVVCKDEFGEYVTQSNRLDTGLADQYRCGGRMILDKQKEDKAR